MHPALKFGGDAGLGWPILDFFTKPIAHPRILNVHKLRADRTTIDRLKFGEEIPERGGATLKKVFCLNLTGQIIVRKSQLRETEKRIFRKLSNQRIKIGNRMPKSAIGVNQTIDPTLQRAVAGDPTPTRCFALFCGDRTEFKAFKEDRPKRFDRTGVMTPIRIILVKEIGVKVVRKCSGHW